MSNKLDWLKVPGKHFSISGLPFTNGAQWHRFSDEQVASLPAEVVKQSRFSAGTVIRFYSDSGSLRLKASALTAAKGAGIDLLVDGSLWNTNVLSGKSEELPFFQGLPVQERLIELYLPGNQEVEISQIGVDVDCAVRPASRGDVAPIVFYGSSIVQGAGSSLSCMNYPAIIGRTLGVDVINFGFYGAGRGEPEVVSEIVKVPAQTIVFDLGKSFGNQSAEVYATMLGLAHEAQPDARLVCVTPIFCLKEQYDTRFKEFSDQLREKFERAIDSISDAVLVNGLELLGEEDWACFSMDGLHPNEWGYAKIAERLIQTIKGGQ